MEQSMRSLHSGSAANPDPCLQVILCPERPTLPSVIDSLNFTTFAAGSDLGGGSLGPRDPRFSRIYISNELSMVQSALQHQPACT